jgi:hypothetical protein
MPVVARVLIAAALAAVVLSGCESSSNSPEAPGPGGPPTGGTPPAQAPDAVDLELLGRYQTGFFNVGAAEIVAFDARTARAFSVNAQAGRLDVIDLRDPTRPTRIARVDVVADAVAGGQAQVAGGGINSVACAADRCAVAVEAEPDTVPGAIVLYQPSTLARLAVYRAGILPDSIAISADGRFVVTANEAEPVPDYSADPEGSITVVDLAPGVANARVTELDFRAFNAGGSRANELPAGVRIFGRRGTTGPASSVAEDLEPEYVTITADGRRAVVSAQENNALITVQLDPPRIERIAALGFVDHSQPANAFDPSDRDGGARLGTWPVRGLFQPDTIATIDDGGEILVVAANEGDARAYPGFSEEVRVGAASVVLDPVRFPNAAALKAEAALGRLTVSRAGADLDGDGDFDLIQAFGSRGFSIHRLDGSLVFNSGSQFETVTRDALGVHFNSTHTANNTGDSRSDDKGPEPEALAVGSVGGTRFLFVANERVGGIHVYNLADARSPRFIGYVNDRNFGVSTTIPDQNGDGQPDPNPAAGDLGPESLVFVPAFDTPTGDAWLLMGSEVSGTVSIWRVTPRPRT